ncbi:hypothetical protein Enr10x_56070 [Gimesia panareensis]|uniref:Uncharacterized protein n=1 Tax=Gimesia panareensis TaxID=2527978 RepID=A0A517QFC9_9PLAN|nr:hypothetical protein Enr10x_56070 [Gimesia panareensis]QDU53321.1 hypothetical protein Pan110_57060 [Gimesia panareensis]
MRALPLVNNPNKAENAFFEILTSWQKKQLTYCSFETCLATFKFVDVTSYTFTRWIPRLPRLKFLKIIQSSLLKHSAVLPHTSKAPSRTRHAPVTGCESG